MGIDYGITAFTIDEENDLKNYSCWLRDAIHWPQPLAPLPLYLNSWSASHGMTYACEKLSVPESKGMVIKYKDAWAYLTVVEPKPEEVPERAKLFREKIRPVVEDAEGEIAKDKEEAQALFKHIQEVDIEKVSPFELELLCQEAIEIPRKLWELHHHRLYTLFSGTDLFKEMCQELIGIEPDDPIHGRLVAGFDNMLCKVDKELWLLGNKAREMGLSELFLTTEDEALLSKLKESPAGSKWLEEYMEFLKVDGWRSYGVNDVSLPCWIDTPSLGLGDIKRTMARGGDYSVDAARENLVREREKAEKEVLAKVPMEHKEWFTKLMKVAQIGSSWSEDHNVYLDFPDVAVPRKVFLEVGKRFAQAGVIDEPFDIFMLLPDEILFAIVPMEQANYKRLAKWRKEQWQKAFEITPPPFLGQVELLGPMIMKDPIARVAMGIPKVRPELKADLYGSASTWGTVEGTARVIASADQLKELQPGEIMIALATSPAWVTAFNVASAVVCDMGGSLAHAVIVGREFGLPVIVGTMEATQKIKTGMRIRVDADMLAVYILDK